MPIKELVNKYGGKPEEALRRAVRAETPGGNELLDALIVASRNRNKSKDWNEIYTNLISARNAVLNDVANRYELKTTQNKEESNDTEKSINKQD